jgi:hypothetical protein
MSEVERENKSLPPLSQSRYSDMACECLYVHKHVHCAKLGESESAARGTEIGASSCGYSRPGSRVKRLELISRPDIFSQNAGAFPYYIYFEQCFRSAESRA